MSVHESYLEDQYVLQTHHGFHRVHSGRVVDVHVDRRGVREAHDGRSCCHVDSLNTLNVWTGVDLHFEAECL